MHQNIIIGVGGLHGIKIDPPKISKHFTSYLLPFLMNTNTSETKSDGLAERMAGTQQLQQHR